MALPTLCRSGGDALLSPKRFFAERTPRTGVGGRVVGAVAGLHVLGYYAFLVAGAVIVSLKGWGYGIGENLADIPGQVLAAGITLGLFVVLNWLVVSAVLHVAVTLRHGDGTFGDTLFVVAWTTPATLVVLLCWGGGFLFSVAGISLAMSYDSHIVTAAPATKFAGLLGGVLTLLWQGRLWSVALQQTHHIDRKPAVQATAVTVVLGIVALVTTV